MQIQAATKLYLIYFIIIIGILIIFNISAIAQNPEYHNFADQRKMIGISNFWNVISNLPFILISIIAVLNLLESGGLKYPASLYSCYLVFFIGIGAVGLGSTYYHVQPSNDTLLWDRLPMTVSFMAFMSIIIGEYISEKAAKKLMLPLILIGAFSVLYWYYTEQAGHGDLRLYGLVQFAPMLIIPIILLMFPAHYTHSGYFWAILGIYFFAKIFELFDIPLFNILGLSGHTIKHVCAAIGPYLLFHVMKIRN